MSYDLELNNVVETVKKEKAKLVCIQLADGLKPRANEIQEAIESKTKAKVVIWGGSCYGACDLPRGLENLGVDVLIHFGHSVFNKPTYNVK